MALTTIEGIYKDGRIELRETPEEVTEARVLVTFLASAGTTAGSSTSNALTPRQQAALRGYGMLSGSRTVDDFIAERREEAEREMQAAAERIEQSTEGEATS